MGGNALSVKSTRLMKSDFDRVAHEVVSRLNTLLPGNRVYAIEAYRSKTDFGDLDVLVESTGFDPHIAAKALGAVETVPNGPVTSIGVRIDPLRVDVADNLFQVDLIKMEPEAFEFASCYFRFNDLGNLLGRIAHAMGLALRHDGLVHYFRDGDYKFRDIVLTRDFSEALAYLGYDSKRYFEGFNDLEEVFHFVTSSPFFNSSIYLLENRNAASRVRDRKRPTYNAFLKWCEGRLDLTSYDYPSSKLDWIPRMAEFFPAFGPEYAKAKADLARQRELKTHFNGALVSELTGLKDKALSELMAQFKKSFASPAQMQSFVLTCSREELTARLKSLMAT